MKTYCFLFDRLAYLFEKCVCDRAEGTSEGLLIKSPINRSLKFNRPPGVMLFLVVWRVLKSSQGKV